MRASRSLLIRAAALACASLAFAGCGGDDEQPADSREGGVSDAVPDVLYTERGTTPEKIKVPKGEQSGGTEATMRQVVVDFYDAVGRGDGDAACALLTEDARIEVVESVQGAGEGAEDCAAATEALREPAGGIVIGAAAEDEPGAGVGTVETQVPGIEPGNVDVIRDGGRWLVDAF